MVKIIEVHLPEYTIETEPDYLAIGTKVDAALEKGLPDGKYVYRAIGKDDHPNMSMNELIETIKKLGTDKYDLNRKEVAFEDFCQYDHHIHAGKFEIKNGKLVIDPDNELPSLFGDDAKKFYVNVLLDRGYKVRLDLLIIYDAEKMEKAKKVEGKAVRPELEECLWKFKDQNRKKEALAGIVKISR
jgi:hypothetical protein